MVQKYAKEKQWRKLDITIPPLPTFEKNTKFLSNEQFCDISREKVKGRYKVTEYRLFTIFRLFVIAYSFLFYQCFIYKLLL